MRMREGAAAGSRGLSRSRKAPRRGGERTPSDLQSVVRERAIRESEVFRQPSVQTVVCQINVTHREGLGGFTKQSRTHAPEYMCPDSRLQEVSPSFRRSSPGKGNFPINYSSFKFSSSSSQGKGFLRSSEVTEYSVSQGRGTFKQMKR